MVQAEDVTEFVHGLLENSALEQVCVLRQSVEF
jgi:hypothetical protein